MRELTEIRNLQEKSPLFREFCGSNGLKEGEYDLDVKVEGGDLKASYTPKTLKVKVTISAKK